ncbi:molybdate ABC transporter substrate-binding protein [uncultured Succinatimonas sp.]|uniref:molybdate ABC transporter substrate-binding protein n=1 Tax=uncultured Succinatimonas sp. TaxID=1262973 RepID=UPI0025F5C18C|nr:molybdate ABC transporter substrate-binding protein [uncultured Succinatimonas sp.]
MLFKKLIALAAIVSLSFCAQASDKKLQVCATAQMYNALEALTPKVPVEFDAHYTTASNIYTGIINNKLKCDVIISPDERLPISLIRLNKTSPASFIPFTRAKLILWSANPRLFNGNISAIYSKKLKSLAIPDPRLTPVGFAAKQIVSNKGFPTGYLKNKIFYPEHEYQVHSMVANQNVEAGFITLPLISSKTRMANGSYWVVPRGYYPDILYYTLIIDDSPKRDDALAFTRFLRESDEAQTLLEAFGFGSLNPTEKGQLDLRLPGWQSK